MKTLKKFVALMTLAALVAGPAQALAVVNPGDDGENVTTHLTQPGGTGVVSPVIEAKFEARRCDGYLFNNKISTAQFPVGNGVWWCEEDKSNPGAQIVPSGDEAVNTDLMVCAVVAHPDLNNPIERAKLNVSADIYYPLVESPIDGSTKSFCGAKIEQITLTPNTDVDQTLRFMCSGTFDGYGTITSGIQEVDPSLLAMFETYDWDDICHQIYQQEAMVFCGTRVLSYEDPAGEYYVKAHAVYGGLADDQWNKFEYLGLPAFKSDFTAVTYDGPVNQGSWYHQSGNETFTYGGDGGATLKGTGNQVLQLTVRQDDMQLDKSSGIWNVRYTTRLGATPEWTWLDPNHWYYPSEKYADVTGGYVESGTGTNEQGYIIDNLLDLSKDKKMDFGINVEKFPGVAGDSYSGHMTLEAEAVAFTTCGACPVTGDQATTLCQ